MNDSRTGACKILDGILTSSLGQEYEAFSRNHEELTKGSKGQLEEFLLTVLRIIYCPME